MVPAPKRPAAQTMDPAGLLRDSYGHHHPPTPQRVVGVEVGATVPTRLDDRARNACACRTVRRMVVAGVRWQRQTISTIAPLGDWLRVCSPMAMVAGTDPQATSQACHLAHGRAGAISASPAMRRPRRRDRVMASVRERGYRTRSAYRGRSRALAPGDDRAGRLSRGPIEIGEGLLMYTTGAQPTLVVDRMSSARRLTDEELRAWRRPRRCSSPA